MTDNNGWPGKPGVPLNQERDGWHWLKTPDENDVPYEWRGSGECERGRWPAYWVPVDADDWQPAECTYLGPCLTPAEVEARIATARKDGMKDAAKWHEVRSMELSGKARVARNFSQLLRQSDFHMESAAAIRALVKGEGDE